MIGHVKISSNLLAVKLSTAVSKSGSRLLRSNVALRLCHHLVTNQELSHGCATQKGRVEVHVEVTGFDLLGRTVQWCLVDAHACLVLVSSISQNCLLTYCRGIGSQRGCRSVL
jgi:hypothetical protein